MSCCKSKHKISYTYHKLDSIDQWLCAWLWIQGSWVQILFWAIFFHLGGAKKGPVGGPYWHLGWYQGCFLMHLEWFSSTEPNFWVKLPLWAACPFWHFQDIFGIRIQFKISYQQRELLNLWSSYKPKKLDTYFESLVHYRKWIHEYNYIMYFRLENQEASQSSIIRFICLSTKTT